MFEICLKTKLLYPLQMFCLYHSKHVIHGLSKHVIHGLGTISICNVFAICYLIELHVSSGQVGMSPHLSM